MGRTRDIGSVVAPIPIKRTSIAHVIKGSLEMCNASIRPVEEYLPDDLKSFDALLGPLIRCNNEIATTLKDWTHMSPSTSDICGPQQAIHRGASRLTQKLSSIAGSSSSLFPVGGLVMDARELCKIWAGCITNRFQLASFQWFRDTVGARHEYLIFKLESEADSDQSRKDFWLRIERRPSAKEAGSKRKLMGSLLGQFTADDLITLSPQREELLHLDGKSLDPQASVVFGEKLPLRYLVDVLGIIHKESPEYHLVGANCWFYASTIAEILTKKGRAIWELGDISYCDHWKSKHLVNSDQYSRIMNRVRQLREHCG